MKLLIIGMSDKCEKLEKLLKKEFSVIDVVSDLTNVSTDDYDYVLVSSILIKKDSDLVLKKPSGFSNKSDEF